MSARRRHSLLIAVALLVAGCDTTHHLVRSVPSSSGKTVGVYASSAYTPSESAQVGPEMVTRAMRASGSFTEEDVQALAGPLADALATIGPDERIIVSGSGKEIHVYARAGELVIVSYHDGHEVSRHTSALPKTDVAAVPEVKPVEPEVKPVEPEVKPEVKPVEPEVKPEVKPVEPEVKPEVKPVEPEVKPEVKPVEPEVKPVEPDVKPKKDKKPKKDRSGKKHLTETEVRAKLKELDRLRDKGLITEPEYQKKRKELLDQL